MIACCPSFLLIPKSPVVIYSSITAKNKLCIYLALTVLKLFAEIFLTTIPQ